MAVASAEAQVGQGVLTGKLEDAATKQPVSDAVVTVTSPALQGEEVVVTDSTGFYRIQSLPPGQYTVRIEKEQYKPYSRSGIGLRADSTIRIDASLLPEALKAEEVVVVAQAPTVDVGSSTSGQSINQDFTRRIAVAPVTGKGGGVRSFEAVAETAPQAKVDDYGVSINGTTSPENRYVVDGVSVSNPAFGTLGAPLSIEFTREVNVITGGYMPEYGRTTGGVLNVVTKSGSNEFHGSVFANTTPVEASRKQVRRVGDAIETQTSLNHVGDVGFDLGGPIIKDRLWFYTGFMMAETRLNLDRTINARTLDPADPTKVLKDTSGPISADTGEPIYDQTTEVARKRYIASQRNFQWIGKLNASINENNRVQLQVTVLPSSSGGGGHFALSSNRGVPEVGRVAGQYSALASTRVSDAYGGSLKWTTETSNKKLVIDTTLGFQRVVDSVRAADGNKIGSNTGLADLGQVIYRRTRPHPLADFEDVSGTPCEGAGAANALICPVRTYTAAGPGQLYERTIDRYQGNTVLTYLFEGLGHHVAKAGADFEYLTYSSLRGYTGGRVYRENTGGTSFFDYRIYGFLQGPDDPVILSTLKWNTKSIIAGGFVQDSWSILDKVTLNVGVRYDSQLLYGGDSKLAMALPNQWSPRVGVIYDPTQNGRSKIYANFAVFYESVPLNLMDRSGSLEPSAQASRRAADCDPRFVEQQKDTNYADDKRACNDPSRYQTLGGTASPDKKYISTGASKTSIVSDLAPQSSNEFVLGGEYDVVKNGRVGAMYTKRWMNKVIEDASRDEAQTYFIGNPGYGLLRDFNKPTRDYDAFTVYFTKNFADEWLAQVSYTVSSLRGNYAGLFRPETLQLDPNINSDFDLRSLLINRQGPLPGDRTHDIKLFVAKDWPIGEKFLINTGLSLRANSGGPTNVLGSHPIYGADEVFLLPRGSGERLPWQFRIDPKVGFNYKWGQEQTVGLTVDVINLFNFQAATAIDERYTVADVNPIENGTRGDLPGKVTHVNAADGAFEAKSEVNPNFGQPTQYQTPLQLRIGLRTTF